MQKNLKIAKLNAKIKFLAEHHSSLVYSFG